ncbi:alpha-L-arabinofuranosidase C-terminal domain-containing protein [Flavitalea sp. BT771]|uniref:alpha-L-arabinofuranosidase C-terminal domain-containing protein n=1 Tax=Flavitalea sp. BT771 TaxID=3063329 RepID=UPI0026E1BF95|nr:alpha-L-arabinofuranosidase C-terminal domain-containing protein [Flavitalea sp. BT771]MDO6430430.1 alpha-L-arabinofuranosidase C-terminal domain-containing protein [Flavitalea sp. BT771]MDV6219430.1 alpha-L-arabinofuranosidase C-terminal domain-containing protein [Flavitalea sp. BT771]
MSSIRQLTLLVVFPLFLAFQSKASNHDPDSIYLFSYAKAKDNGRSGLQFAWSRDKSTWYPIGTDFSYLRSDYGPWGSDKQMWTPILTLDNAGSWQCTWRVSQREKILARAASADLITWGRQSYQMVTDLSAPALVSIQLPEGPTPGQILHVPYTTVDKLLQTYEAQQYKRTLYNESTAGDKVRFAGLDPVDVKFSLQPERSKPISDMLVGVFFEDLNYAADGGLYAELIQNRDFEYTPQDKNGSDKDWNSTHSWSLKGTNARFTIDSSNPVHPNNPHYAVLDMTAPGAALINTGFDNIPVRKDQRYDLSLFTRHLQGKLQISLVSPTAGVIARTSISGAGPNWKKSEAILTATADAGDAHLELQPAKPGRVELDMISLFSQHTFKDRKNGLRADLARTIADIHPRFVRFPGGCLAHGDGLDNIYRWKNTIGPLESRKPQRNIWNYHQTAGLGYFEYFQFCEDIGAQPVPVVAAGVPCQNSGLGRSGLKGQQGGIPMNEMDEYVQDILDLVEYANGDAHTKWGKVRAEAGHPQPFHLKYIGIGNEDLITDIFEERFTLIYNAMRKAHPEITVIGTVGPTFEGTDYEQGWDLATKLKVPTVDEHYYQSPGWFIYNQDYYDRYDRSRSKVYLGEYAAHLPGRPNNLETALAEALYLTALERNGDIVAMASYAPLLAKEGHTQWNPDLIYFNNSEVKTTVDYEVQKLYGSNEGNEYLPGSTVISNNQDPVRKRISISVVRETASGDLIIKMVNLLPVAVNPSIDLANIALSGTTGTKTVLSGRPDDKKVVPVTSTCPAAANFTTELPPYSFTLLRFKTR